jgi:FkbM family methyltransferase
LFRASGRRIRFGHWRKHWNGIGRNGKESRHGWHCLCANVALTHCLNQLQPIRAAVGDRDDIISVPIIDPNKPFNVGGVRLDDPDYAAALPMPREDVPCITIDSLQLQRCDVIKIDVETMESRVLAGSIETVKRCQPVIFAETMVDMGNDRELINIQNMITFFKAMEYEVRRFTPPLYSPDNMRFCPDNIFPGLDYNVVAWPKNKERPQWFNALELFTFENQNL